MIIALDVHYKDDGTAQVAAVAFPHWDSTVSAIERTISIAKVEPYVPGEFYRRELPCLLEILSRFNWLLNGKPNTIIVDGYAWLNESHEHEGLGAKLFFALNNEFPVIGVAKTAFAGAPSVEVVRNGRKPLYVTAAGMHPIRAAKHIEEMSGKFRLPTLIKRADTLSRAPFLPHSLHDWDICPEGDPDSTIGCPGHNPHEALEAWARRVDRECADSIERRGGHRVSIKVGRKLVNYEITAETKYNFRRLP